RAAFPVGIGIIEAPLRQPAPQRAEACKSDGAVVHQPRIAEVAPAGTAIARLERGIEEARIRHGAVYDERELVVPVAGGFQGCELVLHPRGDAPVARHLRLAVTRDERG